MGFFDFLQPVEHDIGTAAKGTFNFLKSAGTGVVNTVKNSADIVNAGRQDVQGLADIGIAAATNNPTAEQNAINKTQAANKYSLTASRGAFTPAEAASTSGNIIKPLARNVAAIAPLAIPVGKIAEGASLPLKFLAKSGANAAVSAGSTAVSEAANNQPLNLSDIGKNAAAGAVLGAAGEAIPAAAKFLKENPTPLLNNEVGSVKVTPGNLHDLSQANNLTDVHKTLDTIVSPDVATRIAPAILETKDPGVIDNIITRATTPDQLPPSTAVPPVTETPPAEPAALTPQERGYTTSQKATGQYSPELKAAIGGKYVASADKPAVENANRLVELQGLEKTHQQVLEKLQSSSRVDKQDIINAGTVVSHLDAQGRTAEAEQLHQLLAERGTESGQSSQALGALLRRSPEGLIYSAKQAINKAKGEITPEVEQKLQNFKENIRNTEPGSPERADGVTQLKQFVNKQIPASASDKAFAVWRAGLLTGPQTVTKIITSHGVNSVLENLKDIPGAAVDKFVSLFTGQRSLVASARGAGEGFKQGAGAGKELITTGIDRNPGTNASELHQTINFGSGVPAKIAQAYVDFVGHVHGALYKPFYGAAHLQSLYNQGLAAAKTQGLSGAEKENFLQDFVGNPSTAALDTAKHDAENATFQQETALGNIASAIQKKGGIIGKVIAPFTRIPSAIATDLINYSPVGLAKTLVDGIKTASSDEGWTVAAQRQFSQGVGRGLTGTAAIIPGIMLYNKGMMTLEYPTDPKEQKLWALEGKIPDAIKVDGQWRSLGSIGPAGSVLAVGGHIADSIAGGNDIGTALIAGLTGGLRSVESQSYVQGISGALNALNDPGRYASNFLKSETASVIPTISNTVAAATDTNTRQTNSPLDAVKNRIPGLRETLTPKVDALGQPIKSPETGIEKLIDPFQSSTVRSSPIVDELQRLQDAGQGILPSTINKSLPFNSIKTQLTPVQRQELTKTIGEATLKRWETIVSNPGYQSSTDPEKSKVLKNAYDTIAAHQKILFAKENKAGRYSPNYATNRKRAKANKKFVTTTGG